MSAVVLGKGSVLDGRDIGGRRRRHVGRRARSFAPDENVAGKRRDGLRETRLRQLAHKRGLAAPVHRAFEAHLSQHHVGMAREIFVDGHGAVRRLDGREVEPCVCGLPALLARRFCRNRISVVTSVPALALKAVLGSRMAPTRSARSAR